MDALELVRQLIDDLEHAQSLGQHSVAIEHMLATLRGIRDQLPAE
jgi:hypothetical protein